MTFSVTVLPTAENQMLAMAIRFIVALFVSHLAGCQPAATPASTSPTSSARPLKIAVTSQVLLEMTRAICNDNFEVVKLIPNGISSRHWEPSGDDARTLQQAKLILISGAGYEPWKDRVSLPGSRVKDTAAGYYGEFIRIPDAVAHQHGPEGKHSHPGTVWATWLDPDLAIAQLQHVTNACAKVAPEQKSDLETAATKLKAQLEALNPLILQLRELPHPEHFQVIADGPFYQYLTARLDWPLRYMHWEEDAEELSDVNKQELVDMLTKSPESPRRIFLLSTQRAASVEDFVASTGLMVVRIDLCEIPLDPEVEFTDRLRGNLERLKETGR